MIWVQLLALLLITPLLWEICKIDKRSQEHREWAREHEALMEEWRNG